MNVWKSLSVVLGVLVIVFLSYLPFGSAQDSKSIEQMIAEAKTPADHKAISAHYEKEAQEAHKKHADHQAMSKSYATIPVLKTKTGAVAHCNTIATNYEKIAKEYEALAKFHKDMAKSAK